MKFMMQMTIFSLTAVNALHAQLKFVNNGQRINDYLGITVTTGDFNSDGIIDAFVKNDGNYRVYFGDGHGLFNASSQVLTNEGYSYDKSATGDINADGNLEVIEKNIVFLNDGHGKFSADSSLIVKSTSDELVQPQLADLNGDGAVDLVAIANNGGMRVFHNQGDGHFTDSGQKLCDSLLKGSLIAHISLGDVNGDENQDIVCAGWIWDGSTVCPNRVLFGDNLGNFQDSGQLLDEGDEHVHGLKLGDLNNDGFLDIVMLLGSSTRAGRIYWNDGSGHFTAGANIPGSNGQSAAICDFDGDGKQDILVAQGSTPGRVWLNDGTGRFRDGKVRLGSSGYFDVAAGDFNADGKMDAFAVGYTSPNGTHIWLNTTPTTDVSSESEQDVAPAGFQLEQNYPNPFNPTTTINYRLPEYSIVKLKIFDSLGRDVKSLIDSFQSAGEHSITWDATDNMSNPVSSGIYFFKMETGEMTFQKKMLLIR